MAMTLGMTTRIRLVRDVVVQVTQSRRFHRLSTSPPPLAAAFNSRPSQVKLKRRQTGLFGIPQLQRPEGFGELKEECIANSQRLVDEAVQPPESRGRLMTAIFDDLSDELCRVADMAEFLRLAHPDKVMAMAAEDACIVISGLVEKLNTHLGLYRGLERVVNEGDKFPETDVDRHVAKLFLHDFQQCGIHLDDEARQMVVGLNEYVLQVGQQFAAGTHAQSRVDKSALPANIRKLFHLSGDQVVLNGLNVDSNNDAVREAAYKIYYMHNENQEHLLSELLLHRHHLAQLCGFSTFGHRAMIQSLGEGPENVGHFLQHLAEKLKPRLQGDFAKMFNMKKHSNPLATCLEVWDLPYFSNKAKSTWFSLDADKISEYFSLGVCMEGLNCLFRDLFNVRLDIDSVDEGELWHTDVYKLAVKDDRTDEELGLIYCDFFSRAGKPHQDCHFTIRGGRLMADGKTYQNPVVVLMLNLPSPGWTSPTLLSSAMIDNLFHEMGHAMHSMLARTKYQHVTGTRCSTDFAEVPSTLMEYFSTDPRVLTAVSSHYRTGEKLPLETARLVCATKKVFTSVDIHTQLLYALLDQRLHGQHPLGCSTTEVLKRIHNECHPLSYPESVAWHHRFSHLVGYGSRYYSYLMARSVASRIWQQHFQEEPFSREAGERYRRECLAHGGGKPSPELVSDYLGKGKIAPEDLANALIDEIDAKHELLLSVLPDS